MNTLRKAEDELIQKTSNLENQKLFERIANLYEGVEESLLSLGGLLLALGPPELRARGTAAFKDAFRKPARVEIVTRQLGERTTKVVLAAWMSHATKVPATYGTLVRAQGTSEGFSKLTFSTYPSVQLPGSDVVVRSELRVYNNRFLDGAVGRGTEGKILEVNIGRLTIAEDETATALGDVRHLHAAVQDEALNPDLRMLYAENEPYVKRELRGVLED